MSSTKTIFKTSALILVAIIIISTLIQAKKHKTSDDEYNGKFFISIHVNNKIYPLIPHRNMYIYRNFCLEESKIAIEHQTKSINKNGTMLVDKTTIKDSINGYILTDLLNKITYHFNASKQNPKLDSNYALIDKKNGFNFKEDNINMDDINNFALIKDTVINKRNFSQLKKTTEVGHVRTVSTVYVDKGIKRFPFHPLSKYLDTKFEGLATILETVSGDQSFKIQYDYTPDLSEQEKKQINKYISLIKK